MSVTNITQTERKAKKIYILKKKYQGLQKNIHKSTGWRKDGAFDTKDTLKIIFEGGVGRVGGTSSIWKRIKCDSLNRFPYIHNALTAKNACFFSFLESFSVSFFFFS